MLILYLSGIDGICWSKPCDKTWISSSVRSYDEKLCITFFGGLVLDNLSIPCSLRRLHIFLLCHNFMTFTLLLIAILILFNKTEYTFSNNYIFSSILSDLMYFLNSFFLWCLLSNSCSMIILPIWFFNFLFLVCIDSHTVAKVGNRCSCLHNLMYSISSLVFSNFVLRLSNDCKMLWISFPYLLH